MEYHGRRGRRGRNHSHPQQCITLPQNFNPNQSRPWSFLSGLYSFFIMTSLMAIIYLMLEYHCATCTAKCDMNIITKSVDDITRNLSLIKQSYQELETQISKFSSEIPKIEGQIEILETLTNTLEGKDFKWNPKSLTFPSVDIYLNKAAENGKNISQLISKHLEEAAAL